MSGIDQLLSLVKSQGANELRLAVDQEPQMFANGQRLRLTMAATSEFALRHLVKELLDDEQAALLQRQRQLAMDWHVPNVGDFRVHFTEQGAGTLKANFQLVSHPGATGAKPCPVPDRLPQVPWQPLEGQAVATPPPQPDGELSATVQHAQPVTVTDALSRLVSLAYASNASDLHLVENGPIYLRVDGRLRAVSPQQQARLEELIELSDDVRQKIAKGHALDFSVDIPGLGRLRLSLFRCDQGVAAAIRLLRKEAPALNELGFPIPIDDLVSLSHGLVLICGATGSGKSTTLAALARQALQRRSIVLTTLEDPIEYELIAPEHSIVRRRQVGRDTDSFRSGLREALRADPDVILVGELRDPDTIQLTLTAAETGHLILGSIHSGGAASAVERIVDAYPADRRTQVRVQLADSLRAIIAQQLVVRSNGSGRIPAVEVLRVTHAVGNVIREGRTAQIGTLLQSGRREGMISMDRCLADYVQQGVITLEQARAKAYDLESLALNLAQ